MNIAALQNSQGILIGCGSEKAATACAARDLYTSGFFREKRAYAEASGLPWAILSAKMGIVDPDELVRPYNQRIDQLNCWELREWCVGVASQLFTRNRYLGRVAIIAGSEYVDPLASVLAALHVEVINPVAGLGIGQQRAWLRKAVRS